MAHKRRHAKRSSKGVLSFLTEKPRKARKGKKIPAGYFFK